MLTDVEIKVAAERYVKSQSIVPDLQVANHEAEILGWRMATEEHLNTIDRLRDEIRELNRRNITLEQAAAPGRSLRMATGSR